jgi:hypothetical protein
MELEIFHWRLMTTINLNNTPLSTPYGGNTIQGLLSGAGSGFGYMAGAFKKREFGNAARTFWALEGAAGAVQIIAQGTNFMTGIKLMRAHFAA